MQWIAHSTEALDQIAQEIIAALGDCKKIVLHGEMGSGKTTFTKAFCRTLGVSDTTGSPTFSLINVYQYTEPEGHVGVLHHLDLYRLRSVEEALDIGIEDLLYDDSFCLIEWPELIEHLLPRPVAHFSIAVLDANSRQIDLNIVF